MEVIPAIDLRGGACVRLYQGDFDRETVFSRDPLDVALRWEQNGATRLHIVDLDGSREGVLVNLELIKSISCESGVPLQVGGGIRNIDAALSLLDAGIDRVVLGTAAVEDPELVRRLCDERGGNRIVVAVDAWKGRVAIKGWLEETSTRAEDLAMEMVGMGAQRLLYTDISRDGTMSSPDFEGIENMVRETGIGILASGGVSTVEQVRLLAKIGAEGVVLGSALYRGDLALDKAMDAAKVS